MTTILLFIIIAYLMGSLSSAVITSRLFNLPDPRTQGSGNPGATNVLRLGGKKAAIITLLGDSIKGVIPILIAKGVGLSEWGLGLTSLAAFIGHLYPVFFQFKGGKGVATALGCWLALSWPIGLTLMGIWLIVAMIFRYSSLAAIACAILAPPIFLPLHPLLSIPILIMSTLLIYRHKKNIRNLLNKKEPKIGSSKSVAQNRAH